MCKKQKFFNRARKFNFPRTNWITFITSSSAMTERPSKLDDFKKARVNGGIDNDSLKNSHKSLRWC